MQNGFVERFNRIYRESILDAYLFFELDQVRQLTAEWIEEYNERRPHEALGNMTPKEWKVKLCAAINNQTAPFGTGIFLARKGLIQFVCTREAKYVHGMDLTLSGSRSGANAVAVWMILFTHGPHGWFEKINKLLYRTNWLCDQLKDRDIPFYRNPCLNIVTIRASHITKNTAVKYGLVPDIHDDLPNWYKIVVMDHVEVECLKNLLDEMHEASNISLA